MLSAIGTLLESAAITIVIGLVNAGLADNGDGLQVLDQEIGIVTAGAIAASALAAAFVAQLIVSRRSAALSARFLTTARRRLLQAFQNADYLVQQRTGTSRLQDVGGAVAFQASLLPMRLATVVASAVAASMLLLAAVATHPVVAGIVVASGALVGVLMRNVGRRSTSLSTSYLASQHHYNAQLAQWTDVHRELRIFGVEGRAFEDLEQDVERTSTELARLRRALEANGIVYRMSAIAWLLALTIVANVVDVPNPARALVTLALIVRAVSYIQQALSAFQVVCEARAPSEALLEEARRLELHRRAEPTVELEQFDHVNATGVGYVSTNGRDVLSDVTLRIDRGDRLGLVGATGAGKSTLMNLLLGLLEPTAGEVQVNGQPAIALSELTRRRIFGYAGQDSALTGGTVRANVMFHRDDRDDKPLGTLTLRLLPDLHAGDAAVLGPRGTGLSGGQAQRVALLRALQSGPELLVLDEPTSALDADMEDAVVRALAELPAHTTMIMISHHARPLDACTRFVALIDGRVVETGTAAEALKLAAAGGR